MGCQQVQWSILVLRLLAESQLATISYSLRSDSYIAQQGSQLASCIPQYMSMCFLIHHYPFAYLPLLLWWATYQVSFRLHYLLGVSPKFFAFSQCSFNVFITEQASRQMIQQPNSSLCGPPQFTEGTPMSHWPIRSDYRCILLIQNRRTFTRSWLVVSSRRRITKRW